MIDPRLADSRLAELNKAWKEQYGILCRIEGRVDELMYLLSLEGEQSPSDSTIEVSDDNDSCIPG